MDYTPELGEKIANKVAAGDPVSAVCRQMGVDYDDYVAWIKAHNHLADLMDRARSISSDSLVDKLLTVHEDVEDVAKARLISDNIKWIASKRHPTKYGDKLTLDVSGQVDINHAISAAQSRLSGPMCDQPPALEGEYSTESSTSGASATDYQSAGQAIGSVPPPRIDPGRLLGDADDAAPDGGSGPTGLPSLDDLLG